MRLILVRHGETYWNEGGLIQGSGSDIELNEAGLKQADVLAASLKREPVAAIISSPLKRAVATARAIAGGHQLSVEVDTGLREINAGELEGMPISSLSSTFSQYLMGWWQEGGSQRLPGGESFIELQERSWACVERLLAGYGDGTTLIVSHYFVIMAIIFKAVGLPLQYLTKFRVDTGGLSIIEFGERGVRLVAFNMSASFFEL